MKNQFEHMPIGSKLQKAIQHYYLVGDSFDNTFDTIRELLEYWINSKVGRARDNVNTTPLQIKEADPMSIQVWKRGLKTVQVRPCPCMAHIGRWMGCRREHPGVH